MRLPRAYVAALGLVAAVFAFVALTAFNVIPVESLFLVLVNHVFQIFAVTVLAGIGGIFVGMVLAHRILAARTFSPFERELLQSMGEVRQALERLREREQAMQDRLQTLEKRVR